MTNCSPPLDCQVTSFPPGSVSKSLWARSLMESDSWSPRCRFTKWPWRGECRVLRHRTEKETRERGRTAESLQQVIWERSHQPLSWNLFHSHFSVISVHNNIAAAAQKVSADLFSLFTAEWVRWETPLLFSCTSQPAGTTVGVTFPHNYQASFTTFSPD